MVLLKENYGQDVIHSRWIDLIIECVTSVSFKVKVNGELSRRFTPERSGLKQGNPLSPYLFLLCAEGFLALFNKTKEEGHISGIKIYQATPIISHLLFVCRRLFDLGSCK
jgi:hypothetical protein